MNRVKRVVVSLLPFLMISCTTLQQQIMEGGELPSLRALFPKESYGSEESYQQREPLIVKERSRKREEKNSNKELDKIERGELEKTVDSKGRDLYYYPTSRELEEVVVSAVTNRVAERNGELQLHFSIKIPKEYLRSDCQTLFTPTVEIGEKLLPLQPIIFRGEKFKKRQEGWYKRYNSYLSRVDFDTLSLFGPFVNMRELTLFLSRNLPNSTLLTNNPNSTTSNPNHLKTNPKQLKRDKKGEISTQFGLTEEEILEHYKRWNKIERNRERISSLEEKFNQLVKTPYSSGAKLDTVIVCTDNAVEYHYIEGVKAEGAKGEVTLHLSGELKSRWGLSLTLPTSRPISYKISSLTTLIQNIERDNLYNRGVELLRERKYEEALEILRPYRDLNSAITYLSMGKTASAKAILLEQEKSALQHYLLAVVEALNNQEEEAVKHYLQAKELDIRMAYRASLDPEIAHLINKYQLNKDLFQ